MSADVVLLVLSCRREILLLQLLSGSDLLVSFGNPHRSFLSRFLYCLDPQEWSLFFSTEANFSFILLYLSSLFSLLFQVSYSCLAVAHRPIVESFHLSSASPFPSFPSCSLEISAVSFENFLLIFLRHCSCPFYVLPVVTELCVSNFTVFSSQVPVFGCSGGAHHFILFHPTLQSQRHLESCFILYVAVFDSLPFDSKFSIDSRGAEGLSGSLFFSQFRPCFW